MTSTNLLPCPFCGGEAHLSYVEKNAFGPLWFVACRSCKASTVMMYPTFPRDGEERAILAAAWNRRATSGSVTPALPAGPGTDQEDGGWHNWALLEFITNWLLVRNAHLCEHTEEKDGPMAAALNIIDSFQKMAGTDLDHSAQRVVGQPGAVDGGWMPIETRPALDEGRWGGTYLIANSRGQVCPWINGVIHNNTGSAWDWDYGCNATHWRPLPEPPAAASGNSNEGTAECANTAVMTPEQVLPRENA